MKQDYLILSSHKLRSRSNCIIKRIKESNIKFGAIAYRGHSGALVAPIVATALSKPLILIRKDGDDRHSCRTVEGSEAKTYIIIDDFVYSGDTVQTIIQRLHYKKCRGIFCYNQTNKLIKDHRHHWITYNSALKDIPIIGFK